MKSFYCDRVISKNIGRTPENYLCLTDAIIGRSGWMRYRRHEIDPYSTEGHPSDVIDVYRSPAELLSPLSIASALAKPVTDGHPAENVHLANHWELAAGNILNVRPGGTLPNGERTLVADILVTKPSLADKILDGVRECSCAYSCNIEQTDQGELQQTDILYNHLAILPSGRGGREVRLQDSSFGNGHDWQRTEEERIRNTNDQTERGNRMNPFFETTDSGELIALPMSRSRMLSLGLVRKTTTSYTTDSAPALSPMQRKQQLLAEKPSVVQSRDPKRIRAWNAAWKAANSPAAMMFDSAPANPFADMENSIAAARQRLRTSKPNRLVG